MELQYSVEVVDFYTGFDGEKEIVLFADNMQLHIWDGYFDSIMVIVFYKQLEVYGEAFGLAGQYQTCTGWCDIHAKKTAVENPKKELEILESIDIVESIKQYSQNMSESFNEEVIKVYKAVLDFFRRAEGIIYIEEW